MKRMSEISSVQRCVVYRSDYDELLVECCICQGSLKDPVMLKCLHHCCRPCIESITSGTLTLQSNSSVKCPLCGDTTEYSAVLSNDLLRNYHRISRLCSEEVYCNTCDAQDVAAVYWCANCCLGLCESCYSWHNRFHQRHRSAELEVARTWSLRQLTPASQCSSHKRQMEVQCFTCRGPQCVLCKESCRAGKHDLLPLLYGRSKVYVSSIIDVIRANRERLSRAVSSLQQKYQDVRRRLHEARSENGRSMLVRNKRSLHDATISAFDISVGQVCVNLERIWCICTTVMETRATLRETAILAYRNIEMISVELLRRLKVLRDTQMLKGIVYRCTLEVHASLMCRRKYWQENGAFSIHCSLPHTSDIVLRSCLGATDRRRAAPSAPLLFGQVSVTFRTPVDCDDLALTRDGHVLLAANAHGLLVYSDRGQQLRSWKPERRSNGRDDEVTCVAALCDGGAAVGVFYARLVVLLKLSQTGDTWLQDRHVTVLQSPPYCLAVHSDLLAATEFRRGEQQQEQLRLVAGRDLKLLRLSSGQVLYTQSRDYGIFSVALTALCVVTMSRGPVKRNSGATPCVLDAFSHSGEFLWRHETGDEEAVAGLCVSADTWSRVYVALVRRRNGSSSRVMAISGADGRDSRDVLSSRTHGLHLPGPLSLARGQQRTVLAVLSYDIAAEQSRTVSLYEAKIK